MVVAVVVHTAAVVVHTAAVVDHMEAAHMVEAVRSAVEAAVILDLIYDQLIGQRKRS